MSFEDFLQATAAGAAPDLGPALRALWFEARGDWAAAHVLAQAADSPDGDWVHAYLHRREGDLANAAYWYRRAGQPIARGELRAEWEAIARKLLEG